jgi:hypothetical protein
MALGRYAVVLFRYGGEGSGIESVRDSDDRLDAARALYRRMVMKYPGRLVMLCDRARVVVRSDRRKRRRDIDQNAAKD